MATMQRLAFFFVLFSTCRLDHAEDKRLLLHNDIDIQQALDELRREINAIELGSLAQKTQLEKEINATKQDSLAQRAKLEQEINAVKQESFAQKAQLEKEINATKQDSVVQMAQLEQEITALRAEVVQLKKGQGSTYVRWGRTTCPGNGTEKVYSGYTAGSNNAGKGGATSSICLPDSPTWGYYIDGIQHIGSKIYGTEYEPYSFDQHAFGKRMQDEDVPCALCHSPRPATVMIPGSTSCYQGWTLEYTGYIMTDQPDHTGGTDYTCVDKDPEAVLHGEADQNGHLFYFIEVQCGSLPCQEYPQGRELACAVCSK